MKSKWKVNIIESERGWGQRIDDTKFFDDYDEAVDWVKDYNKDNNQTIVPDWYMYATDPIPVK